MAASRNEFLSPVRRIGIADAVRACLQKYAAFGGRAPRAEFWKFLLAVVLVQIVAILIHGVLFGPTRTVVMAPDGAPALYSYSFNGGWLGGVLWLLAFLPLIAAASRRLQDTDRSGWWLIAPVVLQVGLIFGFMLWMLGPTTLINALRSNGGVTYRIDSALIPLLVLICFAAWIALLVFLVRRGTPGDNRFGPNPLEVMQ